MRDMDWELFKKTGLPQAYSYYKARQRARRESEK